MWKKWASADTLVGLVSMSECRFADEGEIVRWGQGK
jgi:hypothetical protein